MKKANLLKGDNLKAFMLIFGGGTIIAFLLCMYSYHANAAPPPLEEDIVVEEVKVSGKIAKEPIPVIIAPPLNEQNICVDKNGNEINSSEPCEADANPRPEDKVNACPNPAPETIIVEEEKPGVMVEEPDPEPICRDKEGEVCDCEDYCEKDNMCYRDHKKLINRFLDYVRAGDTAGVKNMLQCMAERRSSSNN